MSTILITGGAGFIGSHLCDRLIKEGYQVICVDNFLSGTRKNIAHLLDNPNFQFIEHDVCQPFTIDRKLSAILHFASLASPNPNSPVSYMRYPIETILTNVIGSQQMLQLAKENNCQIIFASTAEVYGNPTVHPQPETYVGNVSSIGKRSSYDEGKRAMEALAMAHFRTHQTVVKIIRIFNTYGPRMRLDDGRIIPQLLNSYLNNVPFAIYGDQSTTRSFAYVDDIIEGVMRVLDKEQMVGQVVNLGNPKEYSLGDTLSLFEKTLGHSLEHVQQPAPPDDPVRRSPDISKAKQLLGWEPKTDFATGLKLTIDSYHSKL